MQQAMKELEKAIAFALLLVNLLGSVHCVDGWWNNFGNVWPPFHPNFIEHVANSIDNQIASIQSMLNHNSIDHSALQDVESQKQQEAVDYMKVVLVNMENVSSVLNTSRNVDFYVDSRVSEFRVVLTAFPHVPALVNNLKLKQKSSSEVLENTATRKELLFKQPIPGHWQFAILDGEGPWNLRIHALSTVDYEYTLQLQQQQQKPHVQEGTSDLNLNKEPLILNPENDLVSGESVQLVATSVGEGACSAELAKLQRPNGDVIDSLKLVFDEQEGVHTAMLTVPKEPFYIAFQGTCGAKRFKILETFQRLRPTICTPTVYHVEALLTPGSNAAVVHGTSNQIEIQLTNQGVPALIEFNVSDSLGFVKSFAKIFFLKQDENATLYLTLSAPADASLELMSTLKIVARSGRFVETVLETGITVLPNKVDVEKSEAHPEVITKEETERPLIIPHFPDIVLTSGDTISISEPEGTPANHSEASIGHAVGQSEITSTSGAPAINENTATTPSPQCRLSFSDITSVCVHASIREAGSCSALHWNAQVLVSGASFETGFEERGAPVAWQIADMQTRFGLATGQHSVHATGSCCVSEASVIISDKRGRVAKCTLKNEPMLAKVLTQNSVGATSFMSQQQLIILLSAAVAAVALAIVAKLIWCAVASQRGRNAGNGFDEDSMASYYTLRRRSIREENSLGFKQLVN